MEGCGYNKCLAALQFHHLDPKKKDFRISGRNITWEKIQPELDKTIMVCANCHTEIHDLEFREKRKLQLAELIRLRAA